jgi:PAS domain S-box-containing protein
VNILKSTFIKIIKRKESPLFLVLFIAGLSLIGWLSGKMGLATYSLNFIPIPQLSVIILILLSILLGLIQSEKSGFVKSATTPVVILIALFSLYIFLNYFFKFTWEVEEIFIKNPERVGNVLIGRMSPITSLLFIFICLGLWGIRQNSSNIIRYVGGSFSMLVFLISSILLIGYLYKEPLLYGSQIIPVSLPSAICFLLYSITLLRIYELKFWTLNLIRDNKITRKLLKSFLPIVVLIVILQGFLITNFSFHLYNPTLSVILILFIVITITILVVYRVSAIEGAQIDRAEQTLRESENKYRTLVENVGEGIGFVSPDEEFLFANSAAERIFGVGKGELLGKNLKEFLSEEQYMNILNQTKIRTKGHSSTYEFELTRTDGKKRNVFITAVSQFDDNKKFIGADSIFRDITERKQAITELRESETKFKTVADYNYDWEFWLSNEKKFIYNSPSCERITGYKPIDFSDNPNLITQIIYPEDLSIYENHLDNNNENKTCGGIDYRIITRSGEIRWINHVCQSVFDESGINIGRRGSNCDITSRKNAEDLIIELNKELKKMNIDKDRFLSILGHDLRSPFNALLGLSEILKENIQEFHIDEIKNMAGDINKTAQSTFNLLEDILTWARAQQGKIPFKPQQLSIKEICKNILVTLNPSANAKKIAINYSATDNLNVFADADMIKTVLRNLVSNAIKFTNNGGAININAEQNSENVTISVSDNGIGIKPDNLAKLFDVGQVLTTTGTADEKGTGLGLLLCKEFVEKHQGKIWVESEVGKGSEFKFTLPFNAEPDEVSVVKNVVSSDEVESQIEKLKILITDDDETSRKFLGISVKQFAKEILYAQNGFEAVVACKDNPDVDLILMDIKMPEMDGFEATRQIRQLNKEVVIIVQTAFTDSGEKEKAKEAGCNDFISKPINKTLLKELIKKHFDN